MLEAEMAAPDSPGRRLKLTEWDEQSALRVWFWLHSRLERTENLQQKPVSLAVASNEACDKGEAF